MYKYATNLRRTPGTSKPLPKNPWGYGGAGRVNGPALITSDALPKGDRTGTCATRSLRVGFGAENDFWSPARP